MRLCRVIPNIGSGGTNRWIATTIASVPQICQAPLSPFGLAPSAYYGTSR